MAGLRSLNSRLAAEAKLARLRSTYEDLRTAQGLFLSSLEKDEDLAAWCEGERTWENSRAAASSIFQGFELQNDTVAVRRRCGLIGCSPATLKLAEGFNEAKSAFQVALREVRPWAVAVGGTPRTSLLRMGLVELGIPRLNTIEAIRRVVVLPRQALRVSWSWTRKARTKKTTREEVLALIASMRPSRQEALKDAKRKISSLPKGTELVKYRAGQLTLVANVTTLNKWKKRTNVQYSTGLPMLILRVVGEDLPPCQAPRREHTRHPRDADRKVEEDDFIPVLRLRRYFNPYTRR